MKAKITVTAYSSENQPSLKGLASVKLNDSLQLSQIRINEGQHGLYISLPQVKGKDTVIDEATGKEKPKYYEVYCPITAELGSELRKAILDAYAILDTLAAIRGQKTKTVEHDFTSLKDINPKVQKVSVVQSDESPTLLGFASVVFGDALAVNNVVIKAHGDQEPYVFLPLYYNGEDNKDFATIYGKNYVEKFKDVVRAAYNQKVKEQSADNVLNTAAVKAETEAGKQQNNDVNNELPL